MSTTSVYVVPSGAIVTRLPLLDMGTQGPVLAKVLGAEPTATTYLIGCPPDTDDTCFILPQTITVGPYASETLPAGAPETGIFEDHFTQVELGPFVFNGRCEMSRTIAQKCTFINDGESASSSTVVTDMSTLEMAGFATLYYRDVTITAGQSLIESGAASNTGAESSGSQASQTSGTESPAASGTSGADDDGAASVWGVSRWAAVGAVTLALVNGLMW